MASTVAYRRKLAFIIGINNYNEDNDKLRYCINDARDLNTALQKIDFETVLGLDWNYEEFLTQFNRSKIQQKSRGDGMDLGLGPITPKSQTLIAFACAPGEVTLDETWNNKNGSFIENLLKHITVPDKDFEEIIRKVARDVHQQIRGIQQPYRTSSLTEEVYLTTKQRAAHTIRKWKRDALTVAGGNGLGSQPNQLSWPQHIFIDDDQKCIYIADRENHRIMKWKFGETTGQIVAGGNGGGHEMNQLFEPSCAIVNKKIESLIICDKGNNRVIQWPLRNASAEKVLISDIHCSALTIDEKGDLYVSDCLKHIVRRWTLGTTSGVIVAGRGLGAQLHEFRYPIHLLVDEDQSIYVTDMRNHRVMKWIKNADQGIPVAGGQGEGDRLTQLYFPQGMTVDQFGDVYVADSYNHRIVCWPKESKQGYVVVGGYGEGRQANQFSYPSYVSFDQQGHLYVVDSGNHRIQKFEIDRN